MLDLFGSSNDDSLALVRVPEPLGDDVLALLFQDGSDELLVRRRVNSRCASVLRRGLRSLRFCMDVGVDALHPRGRKAAVSSCSPPLSEHLVFVVYVRGGGVPNESRLSRAQLLVAALPPYS